MKTALPVLAVLSMLPSAFAANSIPMEIPRSCATHYENLERYWDTQRTLQTWSGMSDLMTACDEDSSLAAKSIEIVVDKAGLDEKTGVPTPGGIATLGNRWLRPLQSKQKLFLKAELLNGKTLNWKFLVSTGNNLSDGVDNPKDSNKTPTGAYDLGRVNDGLSGPQRIQNSQAYCVQGQQYSYVGTPMPYAIFFKGGYAIHSGVVTGIPESHGCVRADPHNARKLYCLLRQKTELSDAKRNRTSTTENYRVTKLKICEALSKGCDENGNTTASN